MSRTIGMSVSDEAGERWDALKKILGVNQNDAMTFVLETLNLAEPKKKYEQWRKQK